MPWNECSATWLEQTVWRRSSREGLPAVTERKMMIVSASSTETDAVMRDARLSHAIACSAVSALRDFAHSDRSLPASGAIRPKRKR